MNLKGHHIAIIAIVVLLIWTWNRHTQHQRDERASAIQQISLTATTFDEQPLQTETHRPRFDFKGYRIQPLADFVIRARVLSREDYVLDAGSKLSPIDLALGWQRMADPEVYKTLNITQGGRWYRYSWRNGPPIPLQEIIESSANMHMIPANESVELVLKQAHEGDYVRIKGMLVEATTDKGWHWRSSLTRSDSGNGSCELIFVEAALVE